uniref:MAM domain-containing protein n=1 Tax=Romanomermis culicivorax TaxID=13658 RepID=A0A915I944_ROMCU
MDIKPPPKEFRGGKCFYHGALGTVEWQLDNRNGLTYVAKFPPKKLGYAILTSTGLVDNPYGVAGCNDDSSSRWYLNGDGDFELNFNYNHEAYNLRLIICFYSDIPNSDRCELVKKSPVNAANNWINFSKTSIKRTFKPKDADSTNVAYNFPIINNDELFMEPWADNRSFDWLPETCNFSQPCGYGTRESKWIRLSGSMDTVYPTLSAVHMPDLPSIAFGSNIMEKATLYSDPLKCLKPNTGVLSLRLWLHGLTSFRMCVVDADKASVKRCGSKFSSFNSSFHSLDIEQPIPIGFFGNDDLNILQLNFEVVNGFIIVDDISYRGLECGQETSSTRRRDPKDIMTIHNVVESQSENVRKEIEAVLSRDLYLFGSYLIGDWSKYDLKKGISAFERSMEFLQNRRGVWQQHVASVSFRSSEIGYAIISSPRFAPLKDSRMILFFKVGRAVQDKKLWFCEYYTTSQSCRILSKTSSDNLNGDWLKIKVPLHQDTQQFQIVISQTTRSNDPQLDQNMIRSINILGC